MGSGQRSPYQILVAARNVENSATARSIQPSARISELLGLMVWL
jgi:hypothetical protein